MIQKLRRLVGIESYEEALRNFDFLLKEEELVKSEIDLMAQDYVSASKGLKEYLITQKDEEVITLVKSQIDSLTSRYLTFLAEKGKRVKKLESEKRSILNKYSDLEKGLQNLKKFDFIESTLKSYRDSEMTLDECNLIIKSITKEKVKYSDNIVFNQNGEILIVQRGPLDTNGPNLWVLPGGHVNMNEDQKVAAKRELREETGYEIDDCTLVGEYNDKDVHIEYYSSVIDTENQSPTLDANETRYSQFVPVKDLYKFPTMYNIWDNVYEVLGIHKDVVNIKKSISMDLVKSSAIENTLNNDIDRIVFEKSGQKKKEKIVGGKGDNKSLSQIAKRHGVKLEDIESEYKKGLVVEKEHTDDETKASEIAKDHLMESPNYYSKLSSVEKSLEDDLEKGKQVGHLVPKKVQIKGKNGQVFMAIRWVDPTSGESPKHAEGLKDSKVITGDTFESSVENIVKSDIPKSDKVRNLINLGIYDTSVLSLLSGEPTPQYFLKQSDIDIKELPDQSASIKTEIKTQQADNDTPQERESNTLLRDIPIEELWDNYERNLKRVIQGRHKFTIAYGTGGVGKAQPLYSKVLTPKGFRTMGELQPGDEVLTPKGNISKVLEVFPQGKRPVYELTFIDGRKCRCDENHIWRVRERVNYTWRDLTLKQILEKGLRIGPFTDGGEWRYGIPFMSKPIEYSNEYLLKIDPWLLGFLLGDGCLSQGVVSFSVGLRDKEFILNKVESIISKYGLQYKYRSQYDYDITINTDKCTRSLVNSYFREVGLFGTYSDTKFIPNEYLKSSIEDRLSLVQGLMDSDGYVIDGTCILSLTSKKLIEQIREIILSLGATFIHYTEDSSNFDKGIGKVVYSITFVLPDGLIPVTLPFKLDRYIKRKPNYKKALSLTKVEYVGEEETKCILIDDEDHLYITDDYLVTHNTFTFRQLAKKFELREYDDEIQPSKEQYDFVVISGKITPTQVYAEMYRHRDKLIVFDDCDSFLATDEVQGFLKAGLDTGESTKISNKSSKKVYNIEGDPESGTIPNTFSFKGRVIAITNLVSKQIDQAVKSRAMCCNLTMTIDETIEKLHSIKNRIEILTADKSSVIEVSQEARDFAFEILKEKKNKLGGDINTRTYSNAVLIAHDGFEDGLEKDKIKREIVSYFDSVTGSFDEQIRKAKGK
jgi:ADP-ribose pyrophosphatase YjhB (NUDIX family)